MQNKVESIVNCGYALCFEVHTQQDCRTKLLALSYREKWRTGQCAITGIIQIHTL